MRATKIFFSYFVWLLIFCPLIAKAAIKGSCSNCHTMHNSESGQPLTFDGSSKPNKGLLKGDCVGCHAQGGTSEVVVIGPDVIPQVFHTGSADLAGGNFAYITGDKGSGASDNKGHNIARLTGADSAISQIPGALNMGFGPHPDFNPNTLTCAGSSGCHGIRPSNDEYKAIRGAHHGNMEGKLDNPTSTAASYRFLYGVKGLESPNWKNESPMNHNEYFGRTTPVKLGCSDVSCHGGQSVRPPDGTMSQFCATCHGEFHTLQTTTSDGVAVTISDPFIRHPTDYSLPASGEYANYTEYSIEAPVARTGTVPDASSNVVIPGSDAVMCLSCHYAHASNYEDMLRWDMSTVSASGTYRGGCLTCHTTK